ncbi:cell wall integrity and stress response component 2 [Chelmon rostratus]|uniref:cell wall integrity and stress response component 2 n=1 Tax=Chelmon rostratus TaxID=109905 RepID=UPI001BE6007F|nr:cell wall integrity and stress response component 2 [Chelmon rostratus]
MNFASRIFIWLLPLTASTTVTSGQNHNFMNVMTGVVGNKFPHSQLTTQEASMLNTLSEVSGRNIRQSNIVDVNLTEEKMTTHSTKSSLQTTQTMPSKIFLSNIQTATTPSNSISFQLKSSTVRMKSTTEVQFKVTTSATMAVTSQASNPTTITNVPSMLRSSIQSQDTGNTAASQFTSGKITHLSRHPTQFTVLISTTTTSSKRVEDKSISTSPVTGDDAMQSTGLYKTLLATANTPLIHITEAKKRQDPAEKNAKSKNGTNHSKAVAGLVSGALVLMMIGFLLIYIKKQKLQRQQITTRDWAGPSPFLEGGADNGQATLRSSHRIPLSTFLPQRLSKRMSLLPEKDDESEDMTPGTTFGDKHQESIFGLEVDVNDVQKSNGSAAVVPEMKHTGNTPEPIKNSVSVSFSQMNDPLSTKVTNLTEDHPATLSGAVKNDLA